MKVPEGPTGRAESSEAVGGPRRGGSPVGVNVRIFQLDECELPRDFVRRISSSAGITGAPVREREHIARGAPPPR